MLHFLNNLRNYEKLKNNKQLYREAGTSKSILSSISHSDFQNNPNKDDIPWLDKPNALNDLREHGQFKSFDAKTQEQLENWVENGFMVLNGFFDDETIDNVVSEVDTIIEKQLLPFHYTNTRVMNCIKHSEAIKKIIGDQRLRNLLDFTMGKQVKLFQTMNFLKGSQAKAHSDSIHMTSEPLGYLVAIWVALEDVHPDSGPVFYVPGSHKLPYLMNDGFETGNNSLLVGEQYYENYTDAVEGIIRENNLSEVPFIAKKGDVLVWHANLLHGGEPMKNESLTRNSLVAHFFCEGVICYHEITERPAIMQELEY